MCIAENADQKKSFIQSIDCEDIAIAKKETCEKLGVPCMMILKHITGTDGRVGAVINTVVVKH